MTTLLPRLPRRTGAGLLSSARPLRMLEALATPHGIDRYLELVSPLLTVRELRAAVVDVRRSTADSVTLTLRPTRQWRGFQAGQFVSVTVDIDGVRRTRCFSPASSQHRADGLVELTVKAHADGLVSRYLFEHARPGLVVGLSQAGGEFRLPAQRPRRVLLISGGSGITPVLSMLRTLCDEAERGEYDGEVTLLHYARSASDVPYTAELDELAGRDNVRIVRVYTSDDSGELTGRLDESHLAAVAPWFAEGETFVCGPASLHDAVRELYETRGIAERLHVEEFRPSLPGIADPGTATGTVTFARSDVRAANSGATLLEQAEAAGLRPEHGCRMGICFSCTQVRTSGCTRDVRSGETNSDPDTEIQLCVSVPVGDVELAL